MMDFIPCFRSQMVENYLKTIYLAHASAVVLSGTATTMVKALAESGLVHYEPYAGVRLTPRARSSRVWS